jgi:hypothetical protein
MKHEDKTAAVAPPFERGVGRPVPERDDEAVKLAHKMARAAGPQKARVMAQAAYMLICTAALVTDPEGYFDWLEKHQ